MPDEPKAAKADLSKLRIDRDRPKGPGGTIAIVAVVLILAGGGFAWTRFQAATRKPEVTAGLVRRVGAGDSGALLSASGYLLPSRKTNVSSKTFGRLDWLGVDVGSIVKKDEIIARLASADLSARVEEAKAALVNAEREYARWKKAVDDGVEPRERLDRVDTELNLARARHKTAEADMEYSLIRAPFDGVVVKKTAEVGESVGPAGGGGTGSTGGAICTIVDPASMEMVADVNETNIAKIQAGQKVEIAADALPDRKVAGEVRQIVPTADRQKGVVQVKIQLLEAEPRFLPEMAARATFLRAGVAPTAVKRVMAPRESVRERDGRKRVLVIEANKVRAVDVETGTEGEDGVEILKGLSGGEQVVTGGDPVSDGDEVSIKEKP